MQSVALLALLACATCPVDGFRSLGVRSHLPPALRQGARAVRPVGPSMGPDEDSPISANAQAAASIAAEEPAAHGHDIDLPPWLSTLSGLEERGLGSVMLLLATVVSMSLANFGPTSAAWLSLWTLPVGPPIGGHVLTLRGWVNEGLMAVFFFLVGLEIKQAGSSLSPSPTTDPIH